MSFDLKVQNGDITIGNDADLGIVTNSDKLIQDILKGLSTPLNSNQFFESYGTLLGDLVVSGINDDKFTETTISSQIQSFLELLQSLQNSQQASGQSVSPSELIASIKKLQVHRNIVDPTYMAVLLTVLTKAFKEANVSFDLAT